MNLNQLRHFLIEKARQDSRLPSVELQGKSIKEILNRAALELRVPVSRLNYEIISRGTSGFMRLFSQRNFHLLVYRQMNSHKDSQIVEHGSGEMQKIGEKVIHGAAHLQRHDDKLFLKVKPPEHGGQKASLSDVSHMIEEIVGLSIPHEILKKIVEDADKEYHEIAEIAHNPHNDAGVKIHIDEEGMQAFATLTPAGEEGFDPHYDLVMKMLREKGVRKGIDEHKLVEITDAPNYHSPLLIAQGKAATHGEDTRIELLFGKAPKQEKDEKQRIDFRRSFHIDTVTAGQVLARVHPATRGEAGYDVFGNTQEAEAGQSLAPPLGKNVILNEKTGEISSQVAGEVSYNQEQGVIEVQEVYVVKGNLTHDIEFLGSVLIKGDVENDYLIKADGNITVDGYVGRSELSAGGKISVKRGINGGDSRHKKLIQAHSIYASYINNIGATATHSIELSDGVVNSELEAGKSIICAGRYAAIVGSSVAAQEEVRAEIVGSNSGVATRIQVGINPQATHEKQELSELLGKHREQRSIIQRELRTLLKQQDLWGDLQSEEDESNHKERIEQLKKSLEIEEELQRTANQRIREIEDETERLAKQASISVQKEIHSGVTLCIGNASLEVSSLYDKAVTLRAKEGEVILQPFAQLDEKN